MLGFIMGKRTKLIITLIILSIVLIAIGLLSI